MGNKFHAKKTIIDGITFDSKIESEYYEYLIDLKNKDLIESFDMQTTFVLQEKYIIVDGQVIVGSSPDFDRIKRKYKAKTISAITYKADFVVYYKDGNKEVIDIKGGILTETFKIKRKLFDFKYPNSTLKAITKNKKTNQWITFEENQKIKNDNKKAKKGKNK